LQSISYGGGIRPDATIRPFLEAGPSSHPLVFGGGH
jgi:hypothetical protein